MAGDIRRYLAGEAILARPPSMTYHLRVFARRHKALVGGAAAVFAVLLAGAIVSTSLYLRAERQRRDAQAARADADRERDSALQAQAEAARQTEHAKATASFLAGMLRDILPTYVDGRPTIKGMLDRAARKIEDGRLANQPEVEVSLRSLIGIAYSELGRHDQAEPHLRRAVEIRRRERGEEHRNTIGRAANLVLTLVHANKLDEAEQLARKNLEIARRIFAKAPPPYAWHPSALGGVLLEKGELDEAEPLLREALVRRRKGLRNRGRHVAGAAWALGRLLVGKGELADAEPLLREAVEKYRDAAGERNVHAGRCRIYLGECLTKMRRYEEAQQHLTGGYAIVAAAVGKGHPYGREGLERLVALYEAWGKREDAAKWRAYLSAQTDPKIPQD